MDTATQHAIPRAPEAERTTNTIAGVGVDGKPDDHPMHGRGAYVMEPANELVKVKLSAAEWHALCKSSLEELRSVPDQARLIIREELKRRGLLQSAEGG